MLMSYDARAILLAAGIVLIMVLSNSLFYLAGKRERNDSSRREDESSPQGAVTEVAQLSGEDVPGDVGGSAT